MPGKTAVRETSVKSSEEAVKGQCEKPALAGVSGRNQYAQDRKKLSLFMEKTIYRRPGIAECRDMSLNEYQRRRSEVSYHAVTEKLAAMTLEAQQSYRWAVVDGLASTVIIEGGEQNGD